MDKKNTLLLTVIAIATLLVAVVGATFAYFASATTTEDLNVTATTPVANGAFTATGGAVVLEVESDDMTEALKGEHEIASAGDSLVVTYTGGANTGCTYNVTFKWDADSDTYTPVTGLAVDGKEFTVAMTTEQCTADGCKATEVTEKQVTAAPNATDITLTQEKIFTTVADTAVTNTYNLTLKIYNLELDQKDTLANKAFKGKLFVDSVQC